MLAIGDGLMTDMKGANDFGCDALLITARHPWRRIRRGAGDEDVAAVLAEKGLTARYFMAALA